MGFFYILGLGMSAAVNMGVDVTLLCVILDSFVSIPRSGIAGTYSRSTFSFSKELHISVHSDYTNYHYHSPQEFFQPMLSLVFVLCYMVAIPMRLKWLLSFLHRFSLFILLVANDFGYFSILFYLYYL